MKEIEILKTYQQFGIDEILSERPINRLIKPIKKEVSEIIENNFVAEIIKVEEIIVEKNSVSTTIFTNMSPFAAISKLAQKHHESKNNEQNMAENNLVSIAEIIEGARKSAEKCTTLAGLEKAVKNFEGCSLKKLATNTVFADGDSKSPIMIIGEAPGNNEDLQGIPFCGDSGKLLNEMFAAIGFDRPKLYITNTLFWRPPGNRRPTEDELALCRPFVEKHIELIKPKLIVLMGATALSSVLNNNEPISKVRGKFLDYQNRYLSKPIKAIALFHPSYLMRQSNKKKLAWQDLLTIEEFLKQNAK